MASSSDYEIQALSDTDDLTAVELATKRARRRALKRIDTRLAAKTTTPREPEVEDEGDSTDAQTNRSASSKKNADLSTAANTTGINTNINTTKNQSLRLRNRRSKKSGGTIAYSYGDSLHSQPQPLRLTKADRRQFELLGPVDTSATKSGRAQSLPLPFRPAHPPISRSNSLPLSLPDTNFVDLTKEIEREQAAQFWWNRSLRFLEARTRSIDVQHRYAVALAYCQMQIMVWSTFVEKVWRDTWTTMLQILLFLDGLLFVFRAYIVSPTKVSLRLLWKLVFSRLLHFGIILTILILGVLILWYGFLGVLMQINILGFGIPMQTLASPICSRPVISWADSQIFDICATTTPEPKQDIVLTSSYSQMMREVEDLASPATWDKAAALSYSLSEHAWSVRSSRTELHRAVGRWRYSAIPTVPDTHIYLETAQMADRYLPVALDCATTSLSNYADSLVALKFNVSESYILLTGMVNRLQAYPDNPDGVDLAQYADTTITLFDTLIQDVDALEDLRDEAKLNVHTLHETVARIERSMLSEWKSACLEVQREHDSKNFLVRLLRLTTSTMPPQLDTIRGLHLDEMKVTLEDVDVALYELKEELVEGRARWFRLQHFIQQFVIPYEAEARQSKKGECKKGQNSPCKSTATILAAELTQRLREWEVGACVANARRQQKLVTMPRGTYMLTEEDEYRIKQAELDVQKCYHAPQLEGP